LSRIPNVAHSASHPTEAIALATLSKTYSHTTLTQTNPSSWSTLCKAEAPAVNVVYPRGWVNEPAFYNIMSHAEPGRNDPCWCGSDKKYKKCHLYRAELARPTRGQLHQAVRGHWDVKTCLHPNAAPGICGRIIDAHTVQRSGALREIIDTKNKVRTFYQIRPDESGRITPRTVGWRQASTFTGFCSVHDAVFEPVERQVFTRTPEQCFLLSYRSICFEMYQKSGSERSNPAIAELIDRGLPPEAQQLAQEILGVMQLGVQKGREDAAAVKEFMDRQLLSGDYRGWRWLILEFTGPLSITTCGAISPNVGLSGEQLQMLHDLNSDVEWLTVNVVPTELGGALVLGHIASATAPTRFVDELNALSDDRLLEILPQFVFAYIENCYFSASWWASLSSEQQKLVTEHARNPNAYYSVPHYEESLLVPWTMSGRRMIEPL
jgi:hypothetical protein